MRRSTLFHCLLSVVCLFFLLLFQVVPGGADGPCPEGTVMVGEFEGGQHAVSRATIHAFTAAVVEALKTGDLDRLTALPALPRAVKWMKQGDFLRCSLDISRQRIAHFTPLCEPNMKDPAGTFILFDWGEANLLIDARGPDDLFISGAYKSDDPYEMVGWWFPDGSHGTQCFLDFGSLADTVYGLVEAAGGVTREAFHERPGNYLHLLPNGDSLPAPDSLVVRYDRSRLEGETLYYEFDDEAEGHAVTMVKRVSMYQALSADQCQELAPGFKARAIEGRSAEVVDEDFHTVENLTICLFEDGNGRQFLAPIAGSSLYIQTGRAVE